MVSSKRHAIATSLTRCSAGQRIQLRGFIILDAGPKFPEYTKKLIQGYKEGKLKISDENETVVKAKFEDIPKTWVSLVSSRLEPFSAIQTLT